MSRTKRIKRIKPGMTIEGSDANFPSAGPNGRYP